MKYIAILATKISSFLLHLIHRGGSLPGSIGLKICPDLLSRLKIDVPVILVTGTNGKTSTCNMIASTFEHAKYRVVTNRKGDNLKEGITTALINSAAFTGKVKGDAVVLEVDELNIPFIIKQLPVTGLVVTNFFRDQLDRAREMEQLIVKIEQAIKDFKGTLILNGNDPNVVRLSFAAQNASTCYFGIDRCSTSIEKTREASEGKFCPCCNSRLQYEYYQYSHIGVFHCPACDFKTPDLDVCGHVISITDRIFSYENEEYQAPQGGLYTMYNCMAVLSIAKLYQLDSKYAKETFKDIKVPDGRNETFYYQGHKLILNLIKNPTGANEVMKVIEEDHDDKTILIVLNDNAQDGTDVSWIYDTFFEKICNEQTKRIIVSGTRCYDMALRLKYSNFYDCLEVQQTLKEGVRSLLHSDTTMYAIVTYTALQPVRNLLLSEMKETK